MIMSRKDPAKWAAYMREYRRRPGNMAKHNAQTREWKRQRRLIDKTWGSSPACSLIPPQPLGRPRKNKLPPLSFSYTGLRAGRIQPQATENDMAEFPSLKIWTDAYLADTSDLTDAEHGAYLIMLMICWRRPDNSLPNDMDWLKRTLGAYCRNMHGHHFNVVVPGLLKRFFHIGDDGFWHQKRLDKEREIARSISDTQRENIGKRWSNRRENGDKRSTNIPETPPRSEENQQDSEYDGNTSNLIQSKVRKKEQTTFVPKKESDAPPSGVADKPATRGHRLPDDWKPTEADTAFAKASGFSDDAVAEMAAEFRDYWGAIPGQRGVKLDWSATWRNNIRNRHRSADVIARRQPKKSRSQEMMELYDETFSRTRDQETRTSTPVLSIVR